MSHRFKGQRLLVRIFIGESDRCADGPHRGKALHEALLLTFRERGCAGATVLRGIAGFGASAKIRTERILALSLDMPIVVELVETEEMVQDLLPDLDRMIGGGLVTIEKVRVLLYRPGDVPDSEREHHRLEGLTPDD
jgi:uncharacterized protein